MSYSFIFDSLSDVFVRTDVNIIYATVAGYKCILPYLKHLLTFGSLIVFCYVGTKLSLIGYFHSSTYLSNFSIVFSCTDLGCGSCIFFSIVLVKVVRNFEVTIMVQTPIHMGSERIVKLQRHYDFF